MGLPHPLSRCYPFVGHINHVDWVHTRPHTQVSAEIAILEQEVESHHTAELAQLSAEYTITSIEAVAGSSSGNGVTNSEAGPGSSVNGVVETGMGKIDMKDGQEGGGVAEGGASAMVKKSKAQKRKVCIALPL